jgi:hypothetical protein|tara:strand:+ start:730 stop:1065 length:336 start_codon:yes stop_codon:yes gene_type:complete
MVDSRSDSIIQSECDAGVATYLSQVHQDHRSRFLKVGILSGLITGLGTLMASRQLGFNRSLALIPAAVGLLGSYAVGLMTQDKKDHAHAAAFEEVCGQYEDEDDEPDETSA